MHLIICFFSFLRIRYLKNLKINEKVLVAKSAIIDCKGFKIALEKGSTLKTVLCSILSTAALTSELAPYSQKIADTFDNLCKILFDFDLKELPIEFSCLKLSEEFIFSVNSSLRGIYNTERFACFVMIGR